MKIYNKKFHYTNQKFTFYWQFKIIMIINLTLKLIFEKQKSCQKGKIHMIKNEIS